MPVNYFCQHIVLFALNTHNINMEYSKYNRDKAVTKETKKDKLMVR